MYSSSQVSSTTLGTNIWSSLLLTTGAFVLREDQQTFDGAITFEVDLYTIPPTDLFNAFCRDPGCMVLLYDP